VLDIERENCRVVKITVYTTPTCGYCHQAKRFLAERGIRFSDYDVSRDSKAAEEMVRVSGQMGVPVIVVDGEVIVGFNRPRLEELLVASNRSKYIPFGLSVADAGKITPKPGAMKALGAFVGKVAPSSLGERAGLQPGDVITKLNGREIRSIDDLGDALSELAENDRVVIDILRGSETLRSEIII
jgi:glutaredoxin 3